MSVSLNSIEDQIAETQNRIDRLKEKVETMQPGNEKADVQMNIFLLGSRLERLKQNLERVAG